MQGRPLAGVRKMLPQRGTGDGLPAFNAHWEPRRTCDDVFYPRPGHGTGRASCGGSSCRSATFRDSGDALRTVRMNGGADMRLCVVGVGASAGGLEAIREMLTPADPNGNFAYVVIQHLDPHHESLLAELLQRHTTLDVFQAQGGEKVERGKVYIIPPGHGLSIDDGRLHLTDFEKPRGMRRPIDDFFESLALDLGDRAVCVILSGTGSDGARGLRAIKEHGGLCIAQDPGTARYDGMPRSADATGLVDFIRPPDRIVPTIAGYFARVSAVAEGGILSRTVNESIDDICAILRGSTAHDFAGYKRSTLARRIERRIQVLDLDTVQDYVARIRHDPDEARKLLSEFLINVTRFFRDTEHFETLRRTVVAPLVENAAEDELRVWVAGCSSGEEAYTLAMIFAHEARQQEKLLRIQIFATDIDERMLEVARQGSYPAAAIEDIPEEMRDLYTRTSEGRVLMVPAIRDMVRFSLHSVVRDPPFSNLDLVTCRNLMIYFGEILQAEALRVFHYALRPGGALFLGPSETVGRQERLFATEDTRARIYRRCDIDPDLPLPNRPLAMIGGRGPSLPATRDRPTASQGRGAATERLLDRYAPPTIHVSAEGEILGSTGELGQYLSLSPSGRATQNAQLLARPGLRTAMSTAIREGRNGGKRVILRDLATRSGQGSQSFDLIADPLPGGTVLLVFRDRGRFQPADEDDLEELSPTDSHVQALEEELRETRSRLHTTVEELETTNEELKSSNEEMMSMNEELQSTNEELATVNDELKSKVDELYVANADLMNFFASTTLPLVVVDPELRIRRFTQAILDIYPFRAGDTARPLSEVTSVLSSDDTILDCARTVVQTGEPQVVRVTDRAESRTWTVLATPYRGRNDRLEGATIVFTDITESLDLHAALTAESERLRLALEVTRLGVWELDHRNDSIRLDATSAGLLELDEIRIIPVAELLARLPHSERDKARLAFAAASSEGAIDLDMRIRQEQGGSAFLRLVGRRSGARRAAPLLGVVYDVTDQVEAARLRDLMLREMDHRVKNNLAIILAILRGVGRDATSVRDVVKGVQARVHALARSHDMTQMASAEGPVLLEDVVRAALLPYDRQTAIVVEGPRLPLSGKDLTPLALLLHEWSTNAAKYGVLGPVPGRLSVTWSKGGPRAVSLVWAEDYETPRAAEEGPPGFGTMLARTAAVQVDGYLDTEASETQRVIRLEFTTSAAVVV
jgi:two-component system, chemotaxis family, CheB/CheR fusion protein